MPFDASGRNIAPMDSKRWGVRLAGAAVWGMAAITWGSIAHHLWGVPDVGLVAAILSAALVLALPLARTRPTTTRPIAAALLERNGESPT